MLNISNYSGVKARYVGHRRGKGGSRARLFADVSSRSVGFLVVVDILRHLPNLNTQWF